jgi:lipoprotein-releasing system ATP-binding protein
MLQAKGIEKEYGVVKVLRGVDFTINKGEIVCIKGSSGAGKSTLLHILGTLDKPDSGEIYFNDKAIHQLSSKALAQFRNEEIGFIFQFHHLLPEFSALENVSIPAWVKGVKKVAAENKAKEWLDYLGLSHRMHHKPNQLSGGEQQRVAVARALINQPSIILADEPTGNLDSNNASALHELFEQLRTKFQQTFLIVTHNDQLALTADRTLFMKDGVFVA